MSSVSSGYSHPAGQSRASLQRQFNRLLDDVARLAESDLDSRGFFEQVLERALTGSGGIAGTIWTLSPDGALQVECELPVDHVGLDKADPNRQSRAELLRQASTRGRPVAVPPGCGIGGHGFNPTDSLILLTPVMVERAAVAVLEVWQEPGASQEMQATVLQFLAGLAHYTSVWFRNRRVRELARQQEIWLRLESFSQLVHSSLDLTETAFRIVNEGKSLAQCDRLSVARERDILAVSGVDHVERRSGQMRQLGRLCERVIDWGERLVYRGAPDETLPPALVLALDEYLAVCGCKFLVIVPVGNKSEPFALVLENFDTETAPEPAIERLEILGRHASSALVNAAQFERVPLHRLWPRLGRLQRGKTALRVGALSGVAAALLAALICVPYPLKLEATGQLLPRERRWLYAPVEGRVIHFEPGVVPGGAVSERQPLAFMYDMQLEIKLVQLAHEIAAAQDEIAGLIAQHNAARTEAERSALSAERKQKEFLRGRKQAELKALREQTQSDVSRPGYFWLPAPVGGTVLSWDFRERYTNRLVKPSEPLVRIGDTRRGWEIELRIPHRHAGPILEAIGAGDDSTELDVDLLLTSLPTRSYRGKLARAQLAAEAAPDPNGDNPEPVVHAVVRITGDDIPEPLRIPVDSLVSGTEVHARIRCGNRALGFALFHGVWEFLYEKVLFF